MTDDLHALSGAYVMDALEPDERARFEAYMATSPSTAAEVSSLQETVALLGSDAAETPPPGLRSAVLAEVDRTRQERPVIDLRERERREDRPAVDQAAPRGWPLRLAVAAAAAAVLVSAGLGLRVASLSGQVEDLAATSDRIAAVVAADDAAQARAVLPGGGAVTSVVSESSGAGVAIATSLQRLADDEMYALWGIAAGVPVPIGELIEGRPLAVDAQAFEALGVTIEPRGELTMPTSAVIATLPA